MGVVLVIDGNVNVRVICEVLLDSRGATCRSYGFAESLASSAAIQNSHVAIIEVDLAQATQVAQLRSTLGLLGRRQPPHSVVVVSEDEDRVRQAGLVRWMDCFLPAHSVGAELLRLLDTLQPPTVGSSTFPP